MHSVANDEFLALDFDCSGLAVNSCALGGLAPFVLDVCRGFLNCYEHFSKPFKSPPAHSLSEQNKNGGIWHDGFSNSGIGVHRHVCLAIPINGIFPIPPTNTKSNSPKGDTDMYSTIILDCQTKTATPCSHDCIAYKTCTARKAAIALGIHMHVT